MRDEGNPGVTKSMPNAGNRVQILPLVSTVKEKVEFTMES